MHQHQPWVPSWLRPNLCSCQALRGGLASGICSGPIGGGGSDSSVRDSSPNQPRLATRRAACRSGQPGSKPSSPVQPKRRVGLSLMTKLLAVCCAIRSWCPQSRDAGV
ncbi:hypothetical protein DSO57_1000216 [Entomophthora muscae]|uniref:Uncharacterized protein n=1 Tax=Entomophthora muscae TaxID=34485 RepID=A0ACC2U799_9FUNG|nr:hypothetical protein DSO57_1000216 [Entomophthora muscae]